MKLKSLTLGAVGLALALLGALLPSAPARADGYWVGPFFDTTWAWFSTSNGSGSSENYDAPSIMGLGTVEYGGNSGVIPALGGTVDVYGQQTAKAYYYWEPAGSGVYPDSTFKVRVYSDVIERATNDCYYSDASPMEAFDGLLAGTVTDWYHPLDPNNILQEKTCEDDIKNTVTPQYGDFPLAGQGLGPAIPCWWIEDDCAGTQYCQSDVTADYRDALKGVSASCDLVEGMPDLSIRGGQMVVAESNGTTLASAASTTLTATFNGTALTSGLTFSLSGDTADVSSSSTSSSETITSNGPSSTGGTLTATTTYTDGSGYPYTISTPITIPKESLTVTGANGETSGVHIYKNHLPFSNGVLLYAYFNGTKLGSGVTWTYTTSGATPNFYLLTGDNEYVSVITADVGTATVTAHYTDSYGTACTKTFLINVNQ